MDKRFSEYLHPFLTFAHNRWGSWIWKLNAPTPRKAKDAVLFSGTYERLDADYLITSNVNYMRLQLRMHIIMGLLGRALTIFLCVMLVVSVTKERGIFSFLLLSLLIILVESPNVYGFMKYRLHFEPRICFSRKDNAVFAVDCLGNPHKMPWEDVIWYVILTPHSTPAGRAGSTYAIYCSVVNQTSKKFYKFLNPVYEIHSYCEEDSMRRIEGIYNFIHYYMEHGLEGVKTAYASEELIEKGNLPPGVTLLPPSPPFKPDREFSSRSELIKDILRRYVLFPLWPPFLLEIRPQLKKFPFEETDSPAGEAQKTSATPELIP